MIAKPIISAAEAAGKIKEGDTLMVGGFLACGSPHTIIHALKDLGTKNLTLVCNDTAGHDFKSGRVTGVGYLVQTKQFKKMIVSHIGLNQETQRQMNSGETVVDLVPQGTLAERIRAAGTGLGLGIARNIAHAHGGDLVLENRPQGGLQATLSLPRQ